MVDSKLNKVKRVSVYSKELFNKFQTNRGILLTNVMYKNNQIIVKRKSQVFY